MIRYLTLQEVVELHRLVLEQSGGLDGVRHEDSYRRTRRAWGVSPMTLRLRSVPALMGLTPHARLDERGRSIRATYTGFRPTNR